jgi:DNA helicase-2/ATP-dependent DNA helicase PcrA
VIGGVRFYERKEVKDALAYMRLVINPHDDVSLRRVINVPARGIGKGVMDASEKIGRRRHRRDAAAAVGGLQPALSANSLWARWCAASTSARSRPRRRVARTFRDLIVKLTEVARQEPVSIAIGKMLDQSGYLQDLRDERSEDAEGASKTSRSWCRRRASTRAASRSRR